jgi:hypothetical protein
MRVLIRATHPMTYIVRYLSLPIPTSSSDNIPRILRINYIYQAATYFNTWDLLENLQRSSFPS